MTKVEMDRARPAHEYADALYAIRERVEKFDDLIGALVEQELEQHPVEVATAQSMLESLNSEILATIYELYFMLTAVRVDLTAVEMAKIESNLDLK